MNIEVEQHATYAIARVEGVIDDDAATVFREHLHPLFRRQGTKLILDLTAAPRINSSGIGSLVVLASDANTNTGRVILAAPTPFVANVLSVTKLNQFFETSPSVEEAVQLLTG